MNKALLSLLAVIAVAGCSKPEEEDSKPVLTPIPKPKAATPVATSKPGDWMWNAPKATPKSTPKAVNPLSIPDDPFTQKPKK